MGRRAPFVAVPPCASARRAWLSARTRASRSVVEMDLLDLSEAEVAVEAEESEESAEASAEEEEEASPSDVAEETRRICAEAGSCRQRKVREV